MLNCTVQPRANTGGGRLPLVASDVDETALTAIFDVFRARGREVPVLYRSLGNAPAMLQAWVGLAWPLRNEAVTPRRLRELIIIRVAQLTGAAYEWIAHHDMAVTHGISEAALRDLASWRTNGHHDAEEREVLAMADELTEQLDVSDATWNALAARYGPGELVELLLTAAFYSCVSRVLRTLRLPVDETDPRLGSSSWPGCAPRP